MERERYIIDPWFDAGSMPFSQLHYPFENAELIDGEHAHSQFPADFISEAVDQTRGWFYTLHAIAALIKDSVSYKSCLVVGHILDDKGRKMSKRLGNVVDPWKVIDAHGADAFRWYFYSSGNLFGGARFSDAGVVEGLQRFIIPLWNIYSFFTIYANIDGFDPLAPALPWERLPELDKWIRLKLNRLVAEVTEHLERLEICEAAGKCEAFIEAASNWYVRRSRRRFWQPESDDAKSAAYQTLYHVLVTLSKLLAPFTPFAAEELHQKLVRRFDPQAPLSVHLAEYPLADPDFSDEQLEFAMDTARRVCSLGHAARKDSKLRVRQPLTRVTLVSREPGLREAVASHMDVILDELNVKAVEWAEDEEQFVTYEYRPNFRELGPKFGKQAPQVAQWIQSHPELITPQLAEERIEFELGGQAYAITRGDFEVQLLEKPETIAQRDGQLLLVLDTHVNQALRQEGLAREVVSRLQNRRKALDLDYVQRIAVEYTAPDDLAAAIDAHAEYIRHETLAVALQRVLSVDGDAAETAEIDSMELSYALELV